MKGLISAYACEPGKGSEPEAGWQWVLNNAGEFSQLVVVTRANNRKSIEENLVPGQLENVTFLYFDLPVWISFWKKKGRGIQIYTYLWESFLFLFLLKRFRKNEFDLTRRVTFVSYRFPSFVWYFGKKFILGPVAGGERFPVNLLSVFSVKGKFKELLRMVVQHLAVADPLVLLTLYKASEIIAVTPDTRSILPRYAQKKCLIQPAVSVKKEDFTGISAPKEKSPNIVKLLYAGNLLELKGILMVLKALKELSPEISYEFNLIGDGPDEGLFRRFSLKHNLNVRFAGRIPRKELTSYYLSHDLFVFLSLHDSGGFAVAEAQLHDLPVAALDLGGPSLLLKDNDYRISPHSERSIIENVKNIITGVYAAKRHS